MSWLIKREAERSSDRGKHTWCLDIESLLESVTYFPMLLSVEPGRRGGRQEENLIGYLQLCRQTLSGTDPQQSQGGDGHYPWC